MSHSLSQVSKSANCITKFKKCSFFVWQITAVLISQLKRQCRWSVKRSSLPLYYYYSTK